MKLTIEMLLALSENSPMYGRKNQSEYETTLLQKLRILLIILFYLIKLVFEDPLHSHVYWIPFN